MNKSKLSRAAHISDLCEQARCEPKIRKIHYDQWVKNNWHPHPAQGFVSWWEPDGFDRVSGASVGGHPHARRKWARKDKDGWKHGWYGTKTVDAWNAKEFRDEFIAWDAVGRPDRPESFVSISASLERQKDFWKRIAPVVTMIGKTLPQKQRIKDAFNTDKILEELRRDFPGHERT